MRRLVIMATMLAVFVTGSIGAASPSDWSDCTLLVDDDARLACFDRWAQAAASRGDLPPDYEAEIEQYVINECLLTQIREEGLDETLGEDTALELMKMMMADTLVDARDSVRALVTGESREVRMAVYQVAAGTCINSTRAGR